jgi:hypothetical protein
MSAEQGAASSPRTGRGGRRPGAGRKPNYLKCLAIKPITAASPAPLPEWGCRPKRQGQSGEYIQMAVSRIAVDSPAFHQIHPPPIAVLALQALPVPGFGSSTHNHAVVVIRQLRMEIETCPRPRPPQTNHTKALPRGIPSRTNESAILECHITGQEPCKRTTYS